MTQAKNRSWTAHRWPWAAAVLALALWPAWPFLTGDSSALADPLKYLLHHTGFAASLCLLAVLALTPLRRLGGETPWAQGLVQHRRFLGLAAAGLAGLHLGIHILYEGGPEVLLDNVRKPFLAAGLVAFALLLVLALTSTRGWQRRLGRRWKTLHRGAYVAAALVAWHQIDAHKLFPTEILWWYLPWLALQLCRWLPRSVTTASAG